MRNGNKLVYTRVIRPKSRFNKQISSKNSQILSNNNFSDIFEQIANNDTGNGYGLDTMPRTTGECAYFQFKYAIYLVILKHLYQINIVFSAIPC